MARAAKTAHDYFRPSEAVGDVPDYGDHAVTQVAITVNNLGDGLSESTEIEQLFIPEGTKVVGIFYAECVSHEYDFAKGEKRGEVNREERRLTLVLKAEGAFFPDPDLIAGAVRAHQERVQQHRDAEAERKSGQGRMADGTTGEIPEAAKVNGKGARLPDPDN